MKKNLMNSVFVVEGKTDVAFLSTFLDTNFIITNGSEISKKTLKTIAKLSLEKQIIILTDPDFPGKKIRDAVAEVVPNAMHVFVRKEFSIKHHKVGVAESTQVEVLHALENIKSFDKNAKKTFDLNFIADHGYLGIYNQKLRNYISDKIGIDVCNSKRFFDRLNELNIKDDYFISLVEEYKKEYGA